jgi:hypothetical protein
MYDAMPEMATNLSFPKVKSHVEYVVTRFCQILWAFSIVGWSTCCSYLAAFLREKIALLSWTGIRLSGMASGNRLQACSA